MLLFEELRTFNHNAKYDHYFRVYCASHKSLNFNINISFSESLQGEPVISLPEVRGIDAYKILI